LSSPANSTQVGPPPTTINVNNLLLSSAESNGFDALSKHSISLALIFLASQRFLRKKT
jgi:hypothetical protein